MVANGILTNPALFSGAHITPLECVQKWVDICFNSEFKSLYHDDINEWYFSAEENAKPLTFQCFHHHLVFMLEKILPKLARRIFNNLQTFKGVIEFLDDNLGIKVNKLDNFMHELYKPIPMCYENHLIKYYDLLTKYETEHNQNVKSYDYNSNNGKYFNNFLTSSDEESVISDLFTELD